MNDYYQNELDNLRERAVEFARAFPALAPQLSSASTDPDVERILEGVAFLTSKIRQKIDDDFPEFAQGLLKHIFPHYLRPLPSATIIEFSPKTILKNKLTMPAGTFIDSAKVDDVSCRFSTSYDVDVWPLKISGVKLGETNTGKKTLDLEFEFNKIDVSAWDTDVLRIHLAGDYHGATDLYYILNNYVDQIELSTPSSSPIVAEGVNIQPVGFDADEALLDYPANSFPAYRLIQEYFLLKEKFLFLDIKNFHQYTHRMNGNSFVLRFYLKECPIQIPRLSTSRFVLHATPAVNMFEHDAESILNDHRKSETRLKPLRDRNNQYQIYSVNQVVGKNRKTSKLTEYKEVGLADPDTNTKAVYQITHRLDDTDKSSNAYISFSYPPGYPLDTQETLLIRMSCTNGALASCLRPGDISKPTANTSALVEFRNLQQPSEYQDIPSGPSMLWRLLSHLSLNYLSLADIENFKALLGLYVFSSTGGSKQEAINRKRINGITRIDVLPCDRLVDGIAMRGQAIHVQIKPDFYASKGDMYLFGMLLDYLFGSFSSLNSFTEFTLKDEDSDEVFNWAPRLGDRPLI